MSEQELAFMDEIREDYTKWSDELDQEDDFDYIEYEDYMRTITNMKYEREDDEWQ